MTSCLHLTYVHIRANRQRLGALKWLDGQLLSHPAYPPCLNRFQLDWVLRYAHAGILTMQEIVFLVHSAATLGMFGLIWFVQIVHYPLFAHVGRDRFSAYEQAHTRWTTWVVGPGMIAEAATGVALLSIRPAVIHVSLVWIGLGFLASIWLSTALIQVPLHRKLNDGFDPAAHRSLVRSNWVRTAAWTARAMLVLEMARAAI